LAVAIGACAKTARGIGSMMDELTASTEPVPSIGQRLTFLERRIERLQAEVRALAECGMTTMPYVTVAQMRALGDRVLAEGLMRARCLIVHIDATTTLCRILGRYKMYLDRRDVGFAPHLMFEGFWEYWLTEFIWRNVQPGQVALDVGANHGYYSVLLADLTGPEGMVHAFEPNPRMVQLVRQTAALNGFWQTIQVHPVALGATSGKPMLFFATEAEPKNGRLLQDHEAEVALRKDATANVYEVPVRSLDDAIPGRVDFIKIDVEGAEELVWHGMQRLIDRNPDVKIVMEFNPSRCRAAAATLQEIAARFPLREIGFDGQVHPCTPEQLLPRREDALLYLSRVDPA
jgi:FkbM family methyltransferase